MKINRQFQDLHSRAAPVDWELKQHVERDICLLYHQLADYSYIMGDLYYGTVFCLPYWEYLDFPGLDTADREFLRDGCLVMILAMAWAQIDGSCTPFNSQQIQLCRVAIARVIGEDEDTANLTRAVQFALDVAEQRSPETQEFQELSAWVHKRYVRGYFRRVAEEFDKNPYFQK